MAGSRDNQGQRYVVPKWDKSEAHGYGFNRGWHGDGFTEGLEDIALRFDGDSDEFVTLWHCYESGYADGDLMRYRLKMGDRFSPRYREV